MFGLFLSVRRRVGVWKLAEGFIGTLSAYLYLALPPRKPAFQKYSLFSVVVPRSQELILYILYSSFCRGSVKDVLETN